MRCQCAAALGEMVGGRCVGMDRVYWQSMRNMFSNRIFSRLFDLTFNRLPSQCAVCQAWPSTGMVCEACVTRFAQPVPRCATCALTLKVGLSSDIQRCGACIVRPPPLDECLTAVSYAYPWSDCIASYKFGNNPAWAGAFALLLKSMPSIEHAVDASDVIVPVPLSTARLQDRGYNQALEICKHLHSAKTENTLLLRVKDTRTQSSLSKSERLKNMQHAFAVEPLRAKELQGKRVVLVDDVMTSGATLFAAAATLRQAGATHITAVVFARTEAN
jgi:ComF family protein